jgi:hypothetical protein
MTHEEKIRELEVKIASYENDGAAKLFYALNRKMSEMADRLNATNLKTITLDDPKDKTFDRLKVIWNDAASIATAVRSLGETAGIAGLNEEQETNNKKYQNITTPESISNVLGNTAGQIN